MPKIDLIKKKLQKKQTYKNTLFIIPICISLGFFLTILFPAGYISTAMKIVFGSIYFFYLPGYYVLSHFSTLQAISLSEKIILRIVLSLCIIPSIVLFLNMLSFPITEISIFIIGLLFIGGNVLYFYRNELLGN